MDIGILVTLIGIFFLIMVAAFFATAETALTATSRVRLHALEKSGNARARLVIKIREKKDRMIGSILLVNTLLNILSSALATSLMIGLFGDSGVVWATLIMTVLLLFFSEVLPKTYAVHHADKVSLAIAPIISFVILICTPFTIALSWCVKIFLRLFSVDITNNPISSHLDLLRGAIDMHRGPDEEVEKQRAMLRSILDLYEVDVGDIMAHRKNVAMIDADQSTADIIEQMLEGSYSRMPVWKDQQDNIIGVLHMRPLLKILKDHGGNADKVDIRDILLDPWFIPDTTTLHDQLQAFRERKEHFALVIDEYGTFMGIVTLEDILEEIVGEIDDEHDVRVPGVRRLKGGVYMIDGEVTIRDLNREFEWDLPDEQYSTLAGLILYESQMLPDTGQSFSFFGLQFDIVRRNRNQIAKIRVTAPRKKKQPAPL